MLALPPTSSGSFGESHTEQLVSQAEHENANLDSFQWPYGGYSPFAQNVVDFARSRPSETCAYKKTSLPKDQGQLHSNQTDPADAATYGSAEKSSLAKSTQKLNKKHPLHLCEFNTNGRLPFEAPFKHLRNYETERTEEYHSSMEDQESSTLPFTQQATQPFLDPRRNGSRSMLNEQDEADVLCILLPTTSSALRAVDLIAQSTPQHILQNHDVDDLSNDEEELAYDYGEVPTPNFQHGSDVAETMSALGTQRDGVRRGRQSSKDIALRMSSKIHNVCFGFTFGRNPKRCDLLLSHDQHNKISNCHFRIFVNRHGVLMLEDTSTNGTYVDKVLLTSKGERNKDFSSKQSLSSGSIIELPTLSHQNEEMIRFIVRFPSRDHQQELYNHNITAYLNYIEQADRQFHVAVNNKGGMLPPQMLPFNAMKDRAEISPNASILAAATGENNYGLGWNGGEKYNVVGTIGKGAFAMVYKMSGKKDGEVYACKAIEKRRYIKDGVLSQKVHNEILVMKDLRHPNIVKYIEYHETKSHIYIIMEFVALGDLSVFTNAGNAMPEYMCQIMTHQVMHALDYLHKRGITHRDIKPDNILIASHTPPHFKLSDFGLSKIVKNEETFLKSFCGTLLYCAPEIYPGFQRAKLGFHPSKRARDSEPPKGTKPYEHTVDTWSVAAVLFHLLCGQSPYTGTMDDDGALMLIAIMHKPPRWELLDQAGISDAGVDFVRRALVVDPVERARESELLLHPWLTGNAADLSEINAQASAGADELDASQLSLADISLPEGFEEPNDDTADHRETKRSRFHEPDAPVDLFGGSNRWLEGSLGHWNGNASAQNTDSFEPQVIPGRQQENNRLFGEIGLSALRSSGVLGANLEGALGEPTNGSYGTVSYDEAFLQPDVEGAHVEVSTEFQHDQSREISSAAEPNPLQYPQLLPSDPYAGPAPSLLGAEALVDQLNMGSPESGTSGPTDSKPATPSTPQFFETSASGGRDGSSTRNTKSPATERPYSSATDKAPQFPLNFDGPSSQPSKHDAPNSNTPLNVADSDRTDLPVEFGNSASTDYGSYSDGQRIEGAIGDDSLVPTASNSQVSAEKEKESVVPAVSGSVTNQPPSQPGPSLGMSTTSPQQPMTTGRFDHAAFAKPPMRFGTLTPTQGSIQSKPIRITSQLTTFGRDSDRDVVHPNPKEDRVPKQAIFVYLWYPNMENDMAAGKTDWQTNSNLTAIIFTKTSRYIKINGIRLMKGSGCWLWGKLKTGDVIEVFGPQEGLDMRKAEPRQKEYLRFHCDFSVSGSKEPRKPDEPFKVETEVERYREHEGRRSREGTKSREGSVPTGNSQ